MVIRKGSLGGTRKVYIFARKIESLVTSLKNEVGHLV